MKKALFLITLLMSFWGFSQEKSSNYKKIRVAVADSILIDSVSINPSRFVVKTKQGVVLDSTLYNVDYSKSILKFNQQVEIDSVDIEY